MYVCVYKYILYFIHLHYLLIIDLLLCILFFKVIEAESETKIVTVKGYDIQGYDLQVVYY